ncbi:MAG: GNAT family N-acetyltransferase, partial [Bacteroidetes bacterium]|nr:GNAT family N-acetyltransferase [Bacteroidota bacterium]
ERCSEIYPDWAERIITDPQASDKTLVARSGNKAIGFISYQLSKKENYASVPLMAVAKEFRRRHVLSTLIEAGLSWGAVNHLTWEEINVLATNYPAAQAVTKIGFRPALSSTTLHCWLDE